VKETKAIIISPSEKYYAFKTAAPLPDTGACPLELKPNWLINQFGVDTVRLVISSRDYVVREDHSFRPRHVDGDIRTPYNYFDSNTGLRASFFDWRLRGSGTKKTGFGSSIAEYKHLIVEVSLPRLLFENNVRLVSTREELLEAMERINNILNRAGVMLFDDALENIGISRLDLTMNLTTEANIPVLVQELSGVECSRFDGNQYPTTRTFYNGSSKLLFYDKTVEAGLPAAAGRLLRIEAAFLNAKKCATEAGIRCFRDLYDRFDSCGEVFFSFLRNTLRVKQTPIRKKTIPVFSTSQADILIKGLLSLSKKKSDFTQNLFTWYISNTSTPFSRLKNELNIVNRDLAAELVKRQKKLKRLNLPTLSPTEVETTHRLLVSSAVSDGKNPLSVFKKLLEGMIFAQLPERTINQLLTGTWSSPTQRAAKDVAREFRGSEFFKVLNEVEAFFSKKEKPSPSSIIEEKGGSSEANYAYKGRPGPASPVTAAASTSCAAFRLTLPP